MEYEDVYEWIAFVPQRNSDRGALTKYFGRSTDGEYKYRGIECRQRSTPAFIENAQKELIDVFADSRDPTVVCNRLAQLRAQLLDGDVDPAELVTSIRVSQDRSEYTQQTTTVAALERAADLGLNRSPGQTIEYVVTDDTKSSRNRVQLASEDPATYDSAHYDQALLRAATSVLAPTGWSTKQIKQHLSDKQDLSLDCF